MPATPKADVVRLIIGCVDPRFNKFEKQYKRLHLNGGVCLTIRIAGGIVKVMSAPAEMASILGTIDAALLMQPREFHVYATSHTGLCLGLKINFGDECDDRARDLLPHSMSRLKSEIDARYCQPTGRFFMPELTWHYESACLDFPVNEPQLAET